MPAPEFVKSLWVATEVQFIVVAWATPRANAAKTAVSSVLFMCVRFSFPAPQRTEGNRGGKDGGPFG